MGNLLSMQAGLETTSSYNFGAWVLSDDWVEFALVDGTLRATDYAGQTFVWGTRVAEGEVWVPTVAWTGSRASILLAPPAL